MQLRLTMRTDLIISRQYHGHCEKSTVEGVRLWHQADILSFRGHSAFSIARLVELLPK
jgi:hypothetical protein